MKQISKLIGTAAAAATTVLSFSSAVAASDVTGVWINDTGRGAVEIKNCGNALCGHVVWVKDTSDTKGCGKQIIGDAQSVGDGVWDGGWIYSPEKHKNFDVELKPLSDGTLRVVGYMGTKLFSRTMIWTRAPADLKRCSTIEAATAPADGAQPAPSKEPAAQPKSQPENAPAAGAAATAAAPATPAAVAPAEARADAAKSDSELNQAAPKTGEAATKSAEAKAEIKTDDAGEKPGERRTSSSPLGNLKLGDLELDKVLTKTKSGKCKLDLPWIKVQFDCEQ